MPRALITLALVPALVVAVGAQPPQTTPEQSDATFRSASRLIVQGVSVTDRDGNPVEGLTAADFAITEDGVPQEIAFLEFQRIDATAPPAAIATVRLPDLNAGVPGTTLSEIAVPPPGDQQYRDRRLLVLYFDLTATPPPDQMRAYTNARRFIDTQMTAPDLVAIMTFQGGAVRVKQDFTDDRARLREVIQTLIFGDDLDGDGIPDNPEPAAAFGQDDAEFNIFNTDRQLSALQTAVSLLRPLPERKVLVYFASGLRLNGTDNQAQFRATVNAALRSNVAIHPIDARGLVAEPPLGDATRQSPGGLGMFSGRLAEAVVTNRQRSQDTLYALAEDTGGTAMFDYNDLALGIANAARSIASYYIVGYYTTSTAADGRFRRVQVSLTGGVVADLSYREGYFADKEFGRFSEADKERQLEEALMLENPVTDITIAMEVNYFQLNRAEYFVPVAVKMPGSELALARRRGAARTVIDVLAEVKTAAGVTIQNVRDKLDIRLTDTAAAQLQTSPIQYETGFTLLPDDYVIKFLARDAETGRIGTYETSFTVPNLNREDVRVPISSVVLGSQRVPLGDALFTVEQRVSAEASNPLVSDGQKLIPSVTRVFSTSRDLYVFVQAYQQEATSTQPLVAFVTLFRDGVKAFETDALIVTDGLDPRSKAVPLRFAVPLAAAAPGAYDCQVTILDPTGQRASFWRAPILLVP